MNDLQTQLIILAVIFFSGIISAYAIPYFVRRTKTFKKIQSTWENFRSAQEQADKEFKVKEPASVTKEATPPPQKETETAKKGEGFGIATTDVIEQSKDTFTKEELVKPDTKVVSTDSLNSEFPYKDLIADRHVDKENETEVTKKEPTSAPDAVPIKVQAPQEKSTEISTPTEPVVVKNAPVISLGKTTVQEKTERPVERIKEIPMPEKQPAPITPVVKTENIPPIDSIKVAVPEPASPQNTTEPTLETITKEPIITAETPKVTEVVEEAKPLPDLSLLVERKPSPTIEKVEPVIPPAPVIQIPVPQVVSPVAPVTPPMQAMPVQQAPIPEQQPLQKSEPTQTNQAPQTPQDLWKVLHMQQETNTTSIPATATDIPANPPVIPQPTQPITSVEQPVVPTLQETVQPAPIAPAAPASNTPVENKPVYNPLDSLTP